MMTVDGHDRPFLEKIELTPKRDCKTFNGVKICQSIDYGPPGAFSYDPCEIPPNARTLPKTVNVKNCGISSTEPRYSSSYTAEDGSRVTMHNDGTTTVVPAKKTAAATSIKTDNTPSAPQTNIISNNQQETTTPEVNTPSAPQTYPGLQSLGIGRGFGIPYD